MTQLTLDEGARLRDDGIAKVLRAVDPVWWEKACGLVRHKAQSGTAFSSNDVAVAIGMPDHPSAMGALFRKFRREGVIRPTGEWTRGYRPEQHRREVRLYVGT